MPHAMPVSDFRTHTAVLEADNNRIYPAGTGRDACTGVAAVEADEHVRLRAIRELVSDLKRAEDRADREG